MVKIDEINEDVMFFEMGENKYETSLKNRELFVEGRYLEQENIFFELTFAKVKEYIGYKVKIDLKNRKAYCKFNIKIGMGKEKCSDYEIDLD